MKEYMEKTKVGTGMIVMAGNINGVTSINIMNDSADPTGIAGDTIRHSELKTCGSLVLSDVTITIFQTDSNSHLTITATVYRSAA